MQCFLLTSRGPPNVQIPLSGHSGTSRAPVVNELFILFIWSGFTGANLLPLRTHWSLFESRAFISTGMTQLLYFHTRLKESLHCQDSCFFSPPVLHLIQEPATIMRRMCWVTLHSQYLSQALLEWIKFWKVHLVESLFDCLSNWNSHDT